MGLKRRIVQWLRRRKVNKRLIEFAKTKEGYACLLAMNDNNIILADYDAHTIGASSPHAGKPLRIRVPTEFMELNLK